MTRDRAALRLVVGGAIRNGRRRRRRLPPAWIDAALAALAVAALGALLAGLGLLLAR